jgi:hypothetical protein
MLYSLIIIDRGVASMRIYADIDEQTVSTIEQLADERGISKEEFINKAIDQFIH